MQIVMRDGRLFQGTAIQIVRAMQDIAMPAQHLSLAEYIDWVAGNTRRFEEIELEIKGDSDEARAASLVDEMVRVGLARRA
jgi:hypothetical protein